MYLSDEAKQLIAIADEEFTKFYVDTFTSLEDIVNYKEGTEACKLMFRNLVFPIKDGVNTYAAHSSLPIAFVYTMTRDIDNLYKDMVDGVYHLDSTCRSWDNNKAIELKKRVFKEVGYDNTDEYIDKEVLLRTIPRKTRSKVKKELLNGKSDKVLNDVTLLYSISEYIRRVISMRWDYELEDQMRLFYDYIRVLAFYNNTNDVVLGDLVESLALVVNGKDLEDNLDLMNNVFDKDRGLPVHTADLASNIHDYMLTQGVEYLIKVARFKR